MNEAAVASGSWTDSQGWGPGPTPGKRRMLLAPLLDLQVPNVQRRMNTAPRDITSMTLAA